MKEIFDDLKNTFWPNERILGYQQFAKEKGLAVKRRQQFSQQDYRLSRFELFKGKKGKRLNGILQMPIGPDNISMRIYDYVYFGDAKTRTSTVFECTCPEQDFPRFLIKPKSRIKQVKDYFVREELILKNAKNFHSLYDIQSDQLDDLKYDFNEDFLELLALQTQIWVEGNGKYLLFYFKNASFPIHSLSQQYEMMLDLLDRLQEGISGDSFV